MSNVDCVVSNAKVFSSKKSVIIQNNLYFTDILKFIYLLYKMISDYEIFFYKFHYILYIISRSS